MKHKISAIKAPAVAGVIREKTYRAAIAEIKNCMYDGADMIDLHLSCLLEDDIDTLQKIIKASPLPVLALNYNKTYEWESAGYTEEQRIQSLLRAVQAGADGIDIQGYTYHLPSKSAFCGEDKYSFTKASPKEIVTDEAVISKQCALIDKVHSMGAEVLLSCHPAIPMTSEQVVDLALFLEKRNPDIIKIVTRADNEDDLAESIRAMLLLKKEVKTPISYHASGVQGALSRVVNPALGGQIAFCIDRFSESSTMEQLDLKTAKQTIESLQKIMGVR